MSADSQSAVGPLLPPIVALTGFMAVGKSTIGRELACLLHWRIIDLDCEIERGAGLRVQEIFAQHGEPHFRRLESDSVALHSGCGGNAHGYRAGRRNFRPPAEC